MQQRFWDWNAARLAAGRPAVRVAIGLHHGPALLGNIGDESRMEFAVLGDTVIVASRLEKLARPMDAGIVASDALIEAACREAAAAGEPIESDLEGLVRLGARAVPGHDEPVPVWILPRAMPGPG
jgi:adenylate cyclase